MKHPPLTAGCMLVVVKIETVWQRRHHPGVLVFRLGGKGGEKNSHHGKNKMDGFRVFSSSLVDILNQLQPTQ